MKTKKKKGSRAMNSRFRQHVDALDKQCHRLLAMEPVTVESLPRDMPRRGIYLFCENGEPLYVGRSNRLRPRLQEHCRPSSTHNSAPFAFLLARSMTAKTQATYGPEGSRVALEQDPEFKQAFTEAKRRIRQMEVRYVEETDPVRQALLEIYVAIALDTPHNSFDTH